SSSGSSTALRRSRSEHYLRLSGGTASASRIEQVRPSHAFSLEDHVRNAASPPNVFQWVAIDDQQTGVIPLCYFSEPFSSTEQLRGVECRRFQNVGRRNAGLLPNLHFSMD